MTDYEIYVFFLCFIVFILLTTLSITCLSIIIRLTLRLIRSGCEDRNILKEYRKKRVSSDFIKKVDGIFTGIVCLAFAAVFVASIFINYTESATDIPTCRVVRTGSMESKNPKNTYLKANGLDNQIQTFDLIYTQALPDEMDLKLYDIVVYELDNTLIIHRIVDIEEPNEEHPNCRYFRLQGDAVDAPDRLPVSYDQMRAIYTGKRIPFVGSFILFLQSPAGWLCVLLTVVAMIASPILNNTIQKAKDQRVSFLHAMMTGRSDEY